nr:geranylgeranyl transferase type-1 subunit beta [Quercus suber]
MYLAFLIVSAADLLDSLATSCCEDERQEYINWVYHCQHPDGGFRMWPGTSFDDRANQENARWDPANVPATYFALAILLIMGDDLKRVNRAATLLWLRKMQRDDGSFGETNMNGKIEGGLDPRFAYCATGVRFILRGSSVGPLLVDGMEVEDINIDGLIRCIQAAEVGIADAPYHEPHAGYTFCSLGALAFTARLNIDSTGQKNLVAPSNVNNTLSWLVSRQTSLIDPDGNPDSEFPASQSHKEPANKKQENDDPLQPIHQSPNNSDGLSAVASDTQCAGMNGRVNKVADTCYGFWVGASLHILGQPLLCDRKALRTYLLDKTQHPVLGGFGKFPGDLPDIYHSYLGLAALSLVGDKQVKELDGGMCLSKTARHRLTTLWQQWD